MSCDISLSRPLREGFHSIFSSKENGCCHIGRNVDKSYVRQYRVDKEIYGTTSREPRCDYLLLNDDKRTAYFIELKGSDIERAIEQIDHSVSEISPSLGYVVFRRIVYHTGSHKVNSQKVSRWKAKYKSFVKIQSTKIVEDI